MEPKSIKVGSLPTPIGLVLGRVQATHKSDPALKFLSLTYLAESIVKLTGIALIGALGESNRHQAYRYEYGLVRADGLGSWDQVIQRMLGNLTNDPMPRSMGELLSWCTRRRKNAEADPFWAACLDCRTEILNLLPNREHQQELYKAKDLFSLLVTIRNKTKAHGALGEETYESVVEPFQALLQMILTDCPLYKWDWIKLKRKSVSDVRLTELRGATPIASQMPPETLLLDRQSGLYIRVPANEGYEQPAVLPLSSLIKANPEGSTFILPNGGFRSKGTAEFINYATGDSEQVDVEDYLTVPVELEESETHGKRELDIQGNVLGNLPDARPDYVRRKKLEAELHKTVTETSYPIVTLHGRGGIGKTSLALRVAHDIATSSAPKFDQIIWLSARDIDLLPTGPVEVRPAFTDLEGAASALADWIDSEPTIEGFREALGSANDSGTLFIFDNFESINEKIGFQKFLGQSTRHPNRVLITTRERAFKGDFPIDVSGMELPEATELLRSVATQAGREGLFDPETIGRIHSVAEGHAYVMRLLAGEVIANGQASGLKQTLGRSESILDSVFERSFGQLSESGRAVFLTIGGWKSTVAESSILAVLGQRDIDVLEGLSECTMLALLEEDQFSGGEPAYWAPQLARTFAERKLKGATDQMAIKSDLDQLTRFKVVPTGQASRTKETDVIGRFEAYAYMQLKNGSKEQIRRIDSIFEAIAGRHPASWRSLVEFRKRRGVSNESLLDTVRLALESTPESIELQEERRRLAFQLNLEEEVIAADVAIIESDPTNTASLERAGKQVLDFLTKHKEIPMWQRQSYLGVIRRAMVLSADSLSPTALNKLAWLYLIENDETECLKYARLGLSKNPKHQGCLGTVERLRKSGVVVS